VTIGGRKNGKGGIGNSTIGHAHRILSKALKDAARFDLVVKNVAVTERPPKADGAEIQIVAEHRLQELLDKLRGRSVYPIAVISLFAGLRRGEVLALKWRHIDLDGRILKVREVLEETRSQGIRFKAPKTKAGIRDITLPDILVEALREHRRPTGIASASRTGQVVG
jgi:integrase